MCNKMRPDLAAPSAASPVTGQCCSKCTRPGEKLWTEWKRRKERQGTIQQTRWKSCFDWVLNVFAKEMRENTDQYGMAHASSASPAASWHFLLAEWSVLWPPASAWLAHFATAVAKATTAVIATNHSNVRGFLSSTAKSGLRNGENYHGHQMFELSLSLSIAISGKPAVKLKAS